MRVGEFWTLYFPVEGQLNVQMGTCAKAYVVDVLSSKELRICFQILNQSVASRQGSKWIKHALVVTDGSSNHSAKSLAPMWTLSLSIASQNIQRNIGWIWCESDWDERRANAKKEISPFFALFKERSASFSGQKEKCIFDVNYNSDLPIMHALICVCVCVCGLWRGGYMIASTWLWYTVKWVPQMNV